MIMRVLVVYASADGSTAEIARRIARRLRERVTKPPISPLRAAGSLDGVDRGRAGQRVPQPSMARPGHQLRQQHRQASAIGLFSFWTFSVGNARRPCPGVRKIARTEEDAISPGWATCGRAVTGCSPASSSPASSP